jgi:hypothetical protein
MKFIKDMVFWILAVTITGCGFVYTPQPIGERPSLIETKDWEGTWINEESSSLKYSGRDKGLAANLLDREGSGPG